MIIEVIPALISDKPLIQRMIELFRYDLSEFEDTDLNEHGYFGYSYLDYYWVEADRFPFIVRANRKLAGFVLINQHTYFSENKYSIAEFFILRKYRKCGVGRQAAFFVFDRFLGRWEIAALQMNVAAQGFWIDTIQTYTTDNYVEIVLEDKGLKKIVRCFDNSDNLASSRSPCQLGEN